MTAQDDYITGKLDVLPPPRRESAADVMKQVRDYVEPVTVIADRLQVIAEGLDAQAIFERVLWGEELSDAEAALRAARTKYPDAPYPDTIAQIEELRFRIKLWDRLYPRLVSQAGALHAEMVGDPS